MTDPAKSAPKQGRRFAKGQSGNPRGRPEGSRNKATIFLETILDGEAEALIRKTIALALRGNETCLRLCVDRLLPPRRDRPVSLTLPPIASAADAVQAMAAIVAAVATGEISPSEGDALASLIQKFTHAIEASDLADRVEALEARTWPEL